MGSVAGSTLELKICNMQDTFIFQHGVGNYLVLIFWKFCLIRQRFVSKLHDIIQSSGTETSVGRDKASVSPSSAWPVGSLSTLRTLLQLCLFHQGNCSLGESLRLIVALLPVVHFWPLYWFCSLIKSADVIPCAGIMQWFAFRSCNCALTPNHLIRMKVDQMADAFPHNIKVYCAIWWVSLLYIEKGICHPLWSFI